MEQLKMFTDEETIHATIDVQRFPERQNQFRDAARACQQPRVYQNEPIN